MRCPTFRRRLSWPNREQIDKECAEKLALKHKVRVLEKNSEHRKNDVKEIRVEASYQLKRYYEL